MRFGASIYATDRSPSVIELAPLIEQAGFESLWVGEHSHIPVDGSTDRGDGRSELPEYVARLGDPFVTLGAAAAVTTRLRLGTAICLITQRDPIQLAKEVATLDHLSGGRALLGAGSGWNLAEMANHGTAPEVRFRLFRERIAAMRSIWADDVAEYHGELVDFGPMLSFPKPIQRPGPPVLIAAIGPRALKTTVEIGDGWMPGYNSRGEAPLDRIAQLRRLAAEAGRAPIPVTLVDTPHDRREIERLIELRVERCNLRLSVGPDNRLLGHADALRAIADAAELIAPYVDP